MINGEISMKVINNSSRVNKVKTKIKKRRAPNWRPLLSNETNY